MRERKGVITFQGNPLTLLGDEPQLGQPAPDFQALDTELATVSLSFLGGKVRVLCSVPSLDTPVCDMQTRKFNQEAVSLGPEVEVVTLSMDLPFAQRRWCASAGVQRVRTLSDHRDASFATAYGTLIKELRLLTRAVFVVDPQGILRYSQWVGEITQEPDYDAVIQAVKSLL
ncbi:MAG: thiol peroxidase [Thermodesulfobacteriota bacterium]